MQPLNNQDCHLSPPFRPVANLYALRKGGYSPGSCRAPTCSNIPLYSSTSRELPQLCGVLLEMAIGQDAQVQDGLVALAIAVRAATPFVIADAFHRVQQRLVSSIIACENRLASLPSSLPLTQPEID
jgi:hypothetical protein